MAETATVSNLIFYAQSTISILSGTVHVTNPCHVACYICHTFVHWLVAVQWQSQRRGSSAWVELFITLSELGWKNDSCYITLREIIPPRMRKKRKTKTNKIGTQKQKQNSKNRKKEKRKKKRKEKKNKKKTAIYFIVFIQGMVSVCKRITSW